MAEWAALAVTAAATAYSVYSSEEAASDQREAAKEAQSLSLLNQQASEAQNVEELRRLDREQDTEESLSRARAAASGVAMDEGSTGLYLDDMKAENARQKDWLKRSGLATQGALAQEGRAAYKSGMAQADATRRQGIASGIKGLGSAIGSVGSMAGGSSTSTPTSGSGGSLFGLKDSSFYTQ